MSDVPDWALAARDSWQRRGSVRPSFAAVPGPGQVSVWDFPRPPKMAFDTREIVVRWGDVEVVRTSRAVLLLETSHPPTFYLPWSDVARHLLQPAAGGLLQGGTTGYSFTAGPHPQDGKRCVEYP